MMDNKNLFRLAFFPLITIINSYTLDNLNFTSFYWETKTPPRLQWIANEGYCGEVSTIMAGLKYGQYLSQYDMREIAAICPTIEPCKVQEEKFYLVGTNDQRAAQIIKLKAIEWDFKDRSVGHTENYLGWVKSMVRKGYVPTITVFMNQYLFYGTIDPNAGYPDYDHIVTVTIITSKYDDDLYHDDDVITIEDHGLYGSWIKKLRPYYFSYSFKEFMGDRQYANSKTSNQVYTLPKEKEFGNYGITHSGPLDEDNDLYPVRVDTNVNYEDPSIDFHSETRPEPMKLLLTITASDLDIGVTYRLYKYNHEDLVPTSSFNANSYAKNGVETTEFTASATSYIISDYPILSDNKVFFRVVRADAK